MARDSVSSVAADPLGAVIDAAMRLLSEGTPPEGGGWQFSRTDLTQVAEHAQQADGEALGPLLKAAWSAAARAVAESGNDSERLALLAAYTRYSSILNGRIDGGRGTTHLRSFQQRHLQTARPMALTATVEVPDQIGNGHEVVWSASFYIPKLTVEREATRRAASAQIYSSPTMTWRIFPRERRPEQIAARFAIANALGIATQPPIVFALNVHVAPQTDGSGKPIFRTAVATPHLGEEWIPLETITAPGVSSMSVDPRCVRKAVIDIKRAVYRFRVNGIWARSWEFAFSRQDGGITLTSPTPLEVFNHRDLFDPKGAYRHTMFSDDIVEASGPYIPDLSVLRMENPASPVAGGERSLANTVKRLQELGGISTTPTAKTAQEIALHFYIMIRDFENYPLACDQEEDGWIERIAQLRGIPTDEVTAHTLNLDPQVIVSLFQTHLDDTLLGVDGIFTFAARVLPLLMARARDDGTDLQTLVDMLYQGARTRRERSLDRHWDEVALTLETSGGITRILPGGIPDNGGKTGGPASGGRGTTSSSELPAISGSGGRGGSSSSATAPSLRAATRALAFLPWEPVPSPSLFSPPQLFSAAPFLGTSGALTFGFPIVL